MAHQRQGKQVQALFAGGQPLDEAGTKYTNQLKAEQCLEAGQHHPALLQQIAGSTGQRELF